MEECRDMIADVVILNYPYVAYKDVVLVGIYPTGKIYRDYKDDTYTFYHEYAALACIHNRLHPIYTEIIDGPYDHASVSKLKKAVWEQKNRFLGWWWEIKSLWDRWYVDRKGYKDSG